MARSRAALPRYNSASTGTTSSSSSTGSAKRSRDNASKVAMVESSGDAPSGIAAAGAGAGAGRTGAGGTGIDGVAIGGRGPVLDGAPAGMEARPGGTVG